MLLYYLIPIVKIIHKYNAEERSKIKKKQFVKQIKLQKEIEDEIEKEIAKYNLDEIK